MFIREYRDYKSFGKCLYLSNGSIELYVTVDFGPRIIRFSAVGGENFMFEDEARKTFQQTASMARAYGKDATWYIYGGHRMWLSPEYMPETYYPDNDAVKVTEIANGAILTPPVQKHNKVQNSVEIKLSPKSDRVTVTHRSENKSDKTRCDAIWALSVGAAGGAVVVRQPSHDTGFLANRCVPLWPYSKMNDDRVYWGEKFITLCQKTNCKGPFKFALDSVKKAALVKGGNALIKSIPHVSGAQYPDYGVNFESYTCADFIEIESLSPLVNSAPGTVITHTEQWELVRNVGDIDFKNDADIEAKIGKYI